MKQDTPTYIAQAPGSLMLLGEYAVLEGGKAIISSINKHITVKISERIDNKFYINTSLGSATLIKEEIATNKNFKYIDIALSVFPEITGANIQTEAEFAADLGLGSSAATTVACINALLQLSNKPTDKKTVLELSLQAFKQNNVNGSGADLAASVYGGTIAFTKKPTTLQRLNTPGYLSTIYSGYKTVTQSAIKILEQKHNKQQLSNYYQAIATLSSKAVAALQTKDIFAFTDIMQRQQSIMQQMGVSTAELDLAVNYLKQYDNILAAKISGSGFGDCAIGISNIPIQLNKDLPKELKIIDIEFGEEQ